MGTPERCLAMKAVMVGISGSRIAATGLWILSAAFWVCAVLVSFVASNNVLLLWSKDIFVMVTVALVCLVALEMSVGGFLRKRFLKMNCDKPQIEL